MQGLMLIGVHINTRGLLCLAHENKAVQTAVRGNAAPLFQLPEVSVDAEDGEAELEVTIVMEAPVLAAACSFWRGRALSQRAHRSEVLALA